MALVAGALAGIIIGSIIGGSFVVGLIVWFFLRRDSNSYPRGPRDVH